MASASAAAGAGPPSLAGVGIFFQQDSDTNEIFVKTIVKGGSADRSGVLRVGDVVVQVDQAKQIHGPHVYKTIQKYILVVLHLGIHPTVPI